jgi:hypothetical protein
VLTTPSDAQLRQAAFDHVNSVAARNGGLLETADLLAGFQFGGERIPLVNPQRGIFKPRQMAGLLSIRTVFPRQGGRVWYEDQREAHQQIYAGDGVVEYAFMGTHPDAPDNRWLRDAMKRQIPVIYFLGTSPGRYQASASKPLIKVKPRAGAGARGECSLAFGRRAGGSFTGAGEPAGRSEHGPDIDKERVVGGGTSPGTVDIRGRAVEFGPARVLQADAEVQPWP